MEYMEYKEKEDIIDLLNGCINRMCVTDSEEELTELSLFAVAYIVKLYRWNCKRLYDKKNRQGGTYD